MPGRIHVTAVSSLSRPPGCVRARVFRREVTNLRLILRELVWPTTLDNRSFKQSFPLFLHYFLSRVSLSRFRLVRTDSEAWWNKGWNFRTESGATAPVSTFPLQVCSGSTQVIACTTPRDDRGSPLSTAHEEKRKFTAMGLPAVFRVTVIQQRSSCIYDWN